MRSRLKKADKRIIKEAFSEWKNVGLSTDEADFKAAENAIAFLYKAANLDKPKFIHLASPFSALLYINALGITENEMKNQLWGDLRLQLSGYLRRQLEEKIRSQIKGNIRDHLRALFGGELRKLLEGQLENLCAHHLRERLGNADLAYSDTWISAAWDAWVWGYFDGARRIGVQYPETTNDLLNAHCSLVRSCGAVYPFKDFCIITQRPNTLAFDDLNLVHDANGPAIHFQDGFSIHVWHGMSIPTGWIDGSTLTPTIAISQDNVELRRVACEILGWDTIFNELNATTIDKDDDPMIGELLEVLWFQTGSVGFLESTAKFLRVTCGTRRRFTLPVPPEMTTALQANAWTYGLNSHQYKPEIRT